MKKSKIYIFMYICCLLIISDILMPKNWITISKGTDEDTGTGLFAWNLYKHTIYKRPMLPADDEIRKVRTRQLKNAPPFDKEVFLTFDDGPSRNNTPKILKILNENNVKATFFIVGRAAEENKDIVKALYNNGMCIAAHTYSHEYKIYRDVYSYLADINKCNGVIRLITNSDVPPFLRFPGGSDNRIGRTGSMESIRRVVRQNGVSYVDWNVSSADASGETVAMSIIGGNVISQCKKTDMAVVLMHDSSIKTTTVEALPSIILTLKKQGYVFRTFKDVTEGELKVMIKRGIVNR